MKSITDEYTQQWVITIYKELRNYDNVKQAVNLWIKKKNYTSIPTAKEMQQVIPCLCMILGRCSC